MSFSEASSNSRDSLGNIRNRQGELEKRIDPNNPDYKKHAELEKVVPQAKKMMDQIDLDIKEFVKNTGLNEERIFGEPWEKAVLEELDRTYEELLKLDQISGTEMTPSIEIGLMHAENILIQDLALAQNIIDDEVRSIILEETDQELKELLLKSDECTPKIKIKEFLFKAVKASAGGNLDVLTNLEKEFDVFLDKIPENEKKELQDLINRINSIFSEAITKKQEQEAMHILEITKEQLLMMQGMFRKFDDPSVISRFLHSFNLSTKLILHTTKSITTGAMFAEDQEIYNQPLKIGDHKLIKERLGLVAQLEQSILSGKASTIQEAVSLMGPPEERTKVFFKDFLQYLIDCEQVPGRIEAGIQNKELATFYDMQGKFHKKRNVLASNFETAIFRNGPLTFDFESEGQKQKVTVSSLAELEMVIEKMIYVYKYPQLINKLSKEARNSIDEDVLVETMRETIWQSWGLQEKMPPEEKEAFIHNRDLERILRATVNQIVDCKIEMEIKSILKDQMIKQLVTQNEQEIMRMMELETEKDSFNQYIGSAFTRIKSFELSDEVSSVVKSEVTQMAMMYTVMRICMSVPRGIVDKLIKPELIEGKLMRSTLNTVSYSVFSQVIDNIATIFLYNASLTPGQWGLGLATRTYYELWSCGIYRGKR